MDLSSTSPSRTSICNMYLLTEGDHSFEVRSKKEVLDLLRSGQINSLSWIKDENVEADWMPLETMFPDLAENEGEPTNG